MSGLVFAAPEWAHALWAVAALAALLVWLDHRAEHKLDRFVAPGLQGRLAARPGKAQRRTRTALVIASLLFAVLALMRPQWGLEFVRAPRAAAQLVICLDVSRSMLAEDVAPSRLERAKAEIRDLLSLIEGDHVGLVAFAGRASVLSPLTPDFGFLRLVLDPVGPQSVTRGGTRIGDAIREASASFRETGDVSRTILLITDGEDHDSFPVDAAREAAEKGVTIIAIGYGSETGSEIPVTDPETGARRLLRDSAGRVVESRLDGETLREIALATDGVYVPAGTSALDLESIYEQHIAGLVRGRVAGPGRPVRSEGFQWAVLLSLLSLVGGGLANRRARGAAALLLLASLLPGPRSAVAQEPDEPTPRSAVAQESHEPTPRSAATQAPEELPPRSAATQAPEELPPRSAYNQGLADLDGDALDAAEPLLQAARARAGADGELRHHASYALGWAAAARADEKLEAEPEAALALLREAADHFREAVRLRPGDEDARYNLEIVLRRAEILADRLRGEKEGDLEARLRELSEGQRSLAAAVRDVLERMAELGEEGAVGDALRADFRALSARQREILTDADALAADADAERRALSELPEKERGPEKAMRAAQLAQVETHLHRARERMGHARRELRRRRPERAYRRAAASLDALQRARDQLRGPAGVLDALMRDGSEALRDTRLLGASLADVPGAPAPEAPSWLTPAFLEERQRELTERTSELHTRLVAGLAQAAAGTGEEGAEAAAADPERARLLEQVESATPLVARGEDAFVDAETALEGGDPALAARSQREALEALAEAREHFLALRALIEATAADQKRLQSILESEEPEVVRARQEYAPTLRELQGHNRERAERIGSLLDAERERLPTTAETAEAGDPKSGKVEEERRRLDLARSILALTDSAMGEVARALAEPGDAAWSDAAGSGGRAVRGLDALRRLFFTLVEHLRDTARRQQSLNDETEVAAALHGGDPDETELGEALGPLLPRQRELAETAGALADELEAQSRAEPGALVAPESAPPPGGAEAAGAAERLRRAAELTLAAQGDMEEAAAGLEAEPPALEPVRAKQDTALEQLLEAVSLLAEAERGGEQKGQEKQQAGGQDAAGGQDEQRESAARRADPSQILQAVRDREAARRRERAARARMGSETVERDW